MAIQRTVYVNKGLVREFVRRVFNEHNPDLASVSSPPPGDSITNEAVAGVESRDVGLASALLNTAQQLGGALGLAIPSTIATAETNGVLASGTRGLAVAIRAARPGRLTFGSVPASLSRRASNTPQERLGHRGRGVSDYSLEGKVFSHEYLDDRSPPTRPARRAHAGQCAPSLAHPCHLAGCRHRRGCLQPGLWWQAC